MKRHLTTSLLAVLLLYSSSTLYAQSVKTITLKDGSILKGNLIDLKDHVYTIKTTNLGTININEDDILSITAGEPLTAPYSHNLSPSSTLLQGDGSGSPQLKDHVLQIQNQIMTDPQLINAIMKLTEDKEIQSILMNPQFINDVMSMDPNRIQGSDNAQTLMNNPKMKELIEKIQQSLSSPSVSDP